MKNLYLILFLSVLLFLSSLLTSCRKENPDKNQEYLKNNNETAITSILQKLHNWLDKHKTGISADKISNIELLKQNLDISGSTIQKRNNGDNLIIIPIKASALIKEGFDKNYILNLLVVQNNAGSIKWGTIVGFLPAGSKKMASLSPNTLQNIVNNKPVDDSGMFKFLNVAGTLLYQLEYKNHKLYSWGRPVQNNAGSETNTTDGTIKVNSVCINWYLVTTYYNDDGSTTVTKDYLWTTCDGEGSGGSDGGGGDGGTTQEHNDQIIAERGADYSGETDYTDYDLDYNYTSSVGSTLPDYVPIRYVHTYEIDRNANTGVITGVFMDPTTASPSSVMYPDGYGRNVVRYLTLLNHLPPYFAIGSGGYTVQMIWSCDVNARYTYQDGTPVWTRQWGHSRTITR